MRAFFILLSAVLLFAVLIGLQMAAFRRRHPNAELLAEALKTISGPRTDADSSD
jgi:hypothetical protein